MVTLSPSSHERNVWTLFLETYISSENEGFTVIFSLPLKCLDIVPIELIFKMNCREMRKNCCGLSCSTNVSSV